VTLPAGLTGAERVETQIHHYSAWRLLADELNATLIERRFISEPIELAELHHHVAAADVELDENYMNNPTRSLYALPQTVRDHYLDLVKFVAAEVVRADMLFQAAPIVRFHFPAPFPPNLRGASGRGLQFHSDTLGGHPFSMINLWLALTDTVGPNALHLSEIDAGIEVLTRFAAALGDDPYASSLTRFHERLRTDGSFEAAVTASCHPVPTSAGDLIVFDPRCVHGGAENGTDLTRVSIDFRIVVLPDAAGGEFERTLAARHPRWSRGRSLHPLSARQLWD